MKTGKITRRFQLTLPKEIVKSLHLEEGDSVWYELKDGKIIVTPLVPPGESVEWLKNRQKKAKKGG